MKLKTISILTVSVILMFSVIGCKAKTDQKSNVKSAFSTQKEKVSYIIGFDIGENMKQGSLEVDMNVFSKGIKDGLAGIESKITRDEANQVMRTFQEDMMKKQQAVAEKNKADGKKFLEKNKTEKDVKVLPSGLQYKVLKEGTGPMPKATDVVTTNYVGKLIDGKEFDSSVKRGKPASFPVDGVIPGWSEALQLMKVGSKWQLFVPAELAYGEQGMKGMIPPNSTLIFEVELLSIEKKDNPNPTLKK